MKCNPDPLAPHGFNRNASHNEGRYVCECESWDKMEYQTDLILAMALLLNQHGIEPNSAEILAAMREARALKFDIESKVETIKTLSDELILLNRALNGFKD